jgi:AcrR family transcriptional regulator
MAKTSIDRRVVRTRALLHEALLRLIAQKGYESITVEDICAEANIGRSTFYAHYTGKEDLMRTGLRNLRHALADRQDHASGPSLARTRGFVFSLNMLKHARDHLHLHRALVGSRGAAIARDAIRQLLCERVRSELSAADQVGKNDMPREFVVQYVVGSFMAVMDWWLEAGAKTAPEKLDAMFQRLALDGIASLPNLPAANDFEIPPVRGRLSSQQASH